MDGPWFVLKDNVNIQVKAMLRIRDVIQNGGFDGRQFGFY